MAEVGSFESSSNTASPPTFERNFFSPETLQGMQRDRTQSQATYQWNLRQDRRESERYLQALDLHLASVFEWMDATSIMDEVQNTVNTKETAKESLPKQKAPESSEDREKIATYGNLADLAYVDFSRVPSEEWKTDGSKTNELKVNNVQLDPLSFPNIRSIDKTTTGLTENEQELAKFLNDHPLEEFAWDLQLLNTMPVSRDVSELLYIASEKKFDATGIEMRMAMRSGNSPQDFGTSKGIVTDKNTHEFSRQYASLDPKFRSTMTDIEGNVFELPPVEKNIPVDILNPEKSPLSRTEKLQILRLNVGLEHVRQFKAEKSSELFEDLKKKGFTVVDHFPDRDNGDIGSSGFSAITVKDKEWKVHIAVRGTELTDFGDIGADMKLAVNRVPKNQTKDLITFMERNLKWLPEGEKIRLIGHSLGWALSQLWSVMYDDRVEETYTFNSPWAKKLSVDPKGYSGITHEKLEKYVNFWYNQNDNTSVENRIVNIAGSKWPSIISNLGNDIGFYKIELKGLQSHSITTLVEHVSKETTELIVVDIRGKDNKQNNKPSR